MKLKELFLAEELQNALEAKRIRMGNEMQLRRKLCGWTRVQEKPSSEAMHVVMAAFEFTLLMHPL